jgi:hypothetical protein
VLINNGVLNAVRQQDTREIAAAWFLATAISAGVNFCDNAYYFSPTAAFLGLLLR